MYLTNPSTDRPLIAASLFGSLVVVAFPFDLSKNGYDRG